MVTSSKQSRPQKIPSVDHTETFTGLSSHQHMNTHKQFVSLSSCFREVNCVTVGGDTSLVKDLSSGQDKLHSSHFTCLSPPSHHKVVVRFGKVWP